MAYIGPEPNPGQNREVDDISSSFNGSTTAFTLQVNSQNVSPGSDNSIIVSVGGIVQNPGTDYTIAASTITFTTAPASGLSFFGLVLGQGIDAIEASDGSITAAKLASPLDLPDNQKIRFGTGNDLEIFFDASNSIIREPNAVAGQLIIDGYNGTDIRQGSTGEHMIRAIGGADVELYHNGTKQCETSANGLAFPSGKGIDFSATSDGSGTTSSEILDEYEEGSFDVNYKTGAAGSNTLSAASYSTTGGLYTKIGNMVHFQIRIKCSSHSTVGGQIVIEGLPFTHVSTTIASGAVIAASQMLSGSNNARLIIGGTQIEFQNLDGTALQSGAGGLNFNNEFHCAGTYIAA